MCGTVALAAGAGRERGYRCHPGLRKPCTGPVPPSLRRGTDLNRPDFLGVTSRPDALPLGGQYRRAAVPPESGGDAKRVQDSLQVADRVGAAAAAVGIG